MLKKKKVIFLDIDGVLFLDNDASYAGWEKEVLNFDAECCKRLKRILDKTGCKLVLSSSLRLHKEGRVKVVKSLEPYNIKKEDFVGITPDICSVDRSYEIKYFLVKNPWVSNYIVIDDNDIGYKIPSERIIKTDPEKGITEDIMMEAIGLLKEN